MRILKNSCLLFSLTFIFLYGCRKYQENYLFKNPTKVIARGDIDEKDKGSKGQAWKLVKYLVNGEDSTLAPSVNIYRKEGINMYIKRGKPDNYYYDVYDIIYGVWELHDFKKVLVFRCTDAAYQPTSLLEGAYNNQRNIFVEDGQRWDILKLTKDEMWLKAVNNGNTYEMHLK